MFNFNAQGFLSYVISRNGIITDYSKNRISNLILNSGLNLIAEKTWAECFEYCSIGIGGGESIKSQTSLVNEIYRTKNVFNSSYANSAEIKDDLYILRRTFIINNINADISEVGFSDSQNLLDNLFSRIWLSNKISITTNDTLYLQYELIIKIKPNIPLNLILKNQNGDINCVYQIQNIGLNGISSDGESMPFDNSNCCNEPSKICKAFISNSDLDLAPFGESNNRLNVISSGFIKKSDYINNTFSLTKSIKLTTNLLNNTIRSFGIGGDEPENDSGLVCLITNDGFPFERGKSLNLQINYKWGRIDKFEEFIQLKYWLDEEDDGTKYSNPILTLFDI